MTDDNINTGEPIRARSARGRRRQVNQPGSNVPDPILDQQPLNGEHFYIILVRHKVNIMITEAPLMVRLKDPHQMVEERPKSRLGKLNPFSDGGQTKSEIKETLKRPLSSEFCNNSA